MDFYLILSEALLMWLFKSFQATMPGAESLTDAQENWGWRYAVSVRYYNIYVFFFCPVFNRIMQKY